MNSKNHIISSIHKLEHQKSYIEKTIQSLQRQLSNIDNPQPEPDFISTFGSCFPGIFDKPTTTTGVNQ